MNGVVVRRALARLMCLLAVTLLPACQSYQAYRPTIASAPIVGPAGKAVLGTPTSTNEGHVVPLPAPHGASTVVSGGAAMSSYSMESGCQGTCAPCNSGSCRGGCSTTLKDKLRNADWEQLRTDHCWPEQYNYESRRRVNQPLHDQISAGHATHNTLHDLHFETKDGMQGLLHSSGMERIKYLARRRPYVVPTIFVQTSFDPTIDAEREKNIREFANKVSTEPVSWQVVMVNTAPTGLFGVEGSAAIQKMVGGRAGQTVPTPKYESVLKNGFYQGTGGGQAAGGAGS